VTLYVWKVLDEIVGNTDVVRVAEAVLQRLQPVHKRPNLVLVKEASQELDCVP
jgi:hypothetical protein